jgi:hypothetical protein
MMAAFFYVPDCRCSGKKYHVVIGKFQPGLSTTPK